MAWTFTVTMDKRAGHYLKLKVVALTSDGAALAVPGTDILSQTGVSAINGIQGAALMAIKTDPGSGATAPDQAWDYTIGDDDGTAVLAITDVSNSVVTYKDASATIGMYPAVFDKLYIALPTAGDWSANDTVTFYLTFWMEDR